MEPASPPRLWSRYVALIYVFLVVHYAFYLGAVRFRGASVGVFAVAVALTGPLWLLLPLLVPSALLCRLRSQKPALIAALAAGALLQVFLYLDRLVFGQYGFHFNGFVWNLVTTPGGIESMGASGGTRTSLALIVLGSVGFHVALLAALVKVPRLQTMLPGIFRRRGALVALGVVLALCGVEKLTYGWSRARFRTPVLSAADAFPFYVRCDLTRPARWLGVKTPHGDAQAVPLDDETLQVRYPLSEIRRNPAAPKLNLIWLVSESWRADMLDPEIMPATWAWAKESVWFRNHYSGGNGTRTGMFSMFYGLHGPYWFPFLAERRGPALLDLILKEGYETRMFTSASFSYPEFNRTIFARIPPEQLVEGPMIVRYERDRLSVSKLTEFIAAQTPERPFMSFLFFESPHADYQFPEECAIRKPYAENFNYLTTDLPAAMPLIKNRYINACRHLDTQLARVFQVLKERKLLESSIVVLTGDHGEEFMEKGRWGHNSAFTEEQTRVPLVLRVPGQVASERRLLSSHLDLPATVMTLLGVETPPDQYGLGIDLFGKEERHSVVLSDWDHLCYVGAEHKAVFSLKNYEFQQRVSTASDGPVADPGGVISANREWLLSLMREMRRFRR